MKQLGTIYPIPPYNFQLTLDVLSRYQHPITDVTHDGAYWRLLSSEAGRALLRVTSQGNPETPALEVHLAESTGDIDPDMLLLRIKHILGGEANPNPFYSFARQDEQLWQIIQPLIGLRLLRTDSVFEALMITTIEQQIAWTAAQKAQYWLVQWGGQHITREGKTYYAFPSPEQIARSTIEELSPLKITFKRISVMIEIARQIVAGMLDLEGLMNYSIEEMYKALVAIKGIGHWTASWTIQRTRGRHNYVGHNDVALQAAVNHYFYGGVGKIPEQQVIDTFARYGEFAGVVANYTIIRWVLDRYAVNTTLF